MKIVFLASAKPDLRWFKRYYVFGFPEGRRNADAQFLKTTKLLSANPHVGHTLEAIEGAREFSIPRTPFSLIYRIRNGTIEVMRVLDNRSDASNDWA